jgi:uncharacterized integral membrane protein
MTRWLIAIAVALFTAVGAWMTILNPDPVRLRLTPSGLIERPLAQVLMGAFVAGAALVSLLASAGSLSRAWQRWRRTRRQARLARTAAATAHARALVWAGAYDQARSELGVDAQQVPDDPERVELAAESYLGDGDPNAARALLQRAVARIGPQPRLLDLLAQAAEQRGDRATAIATLEQLRPSIGSTPRLARRLRDLYIAAERFEDALAVQSDLLLGLRRGPSLAAEERALVGLRYVLACRDPDPRRSARRLAALAKQTPDFVPAAVAAGDRWRAAGRPLFARRIWERGALRTPAEPLLDRLEDLYARTDQPARLVKLFEQLRTQHPAHAGVLLRSIQQALSADRLDDAAALVAQLPAELAVTPIGRLYTARLQHRQGTDADGWIEVEATARQLAGTLPHRCGTCRASHTGWADRCSQCGTWGRIDLVTSAGPAAVSSPA